MVPEPVSVFTVTVYVSLEPLTDETEAPSYPCGGQGKARYVHIDNGGGEGDGESYAVRAGGVGVCEGDCGHCEKSTIGL